MDNNTNNISPIYFTVTFSNNILINMNYLIGVFGIFDFFININIYKSQTLTIFFFNYENITKTL